MSSNQRRAPWENAERHYCKLCNAWMGSGTSRLLFMLLNVIFFMSFQHLLIISIPSTSLKLILPMIDASFVTDRQSILLHENGKKHKEKVEESLQARRREKLEEEKQSKLLQQSLAQMEKEAMAKVGIQQPPPQFGLPFAALSSAVRPPPPPPPPPKAPNSQKEEKKEWESRKKKREEEKKKKRGDGDDEESSQATKRQRIQIQVGQGTYKIDEKTYLEGATYFEILEEDLPIQIWTGSAFASSEEMRLPERQQSWKDAIVAAARKTPEKCIVHVSYLASDDDEDETLEKSVKLERIRLVLGGDDNIPDTLEEARLLAMGGEEINVEPPTQEEIDEATGFTGWSTVAIKRTTVRQENKEERERHREKRKAAAAEKEAQQKQAEARRMEEAKVSNADDSALGAYDPLFGGKGGYKGVDIQKEADVKVEDTAKSLSSGKVNVGFKKKVKKPMGNRNRRRTTADDEDD
jgi:WW domain-binding protein 4